MTSKKNIYRFFYNATFLVIKRITDVLWNKIRWYRPIERVGKLRVTYFYFSLFFSPSRWRWHIFSFFFFFSTTIPSCLRIVKSFFHEYFVYIYIIGHLCTKSIFNPCLLIAIRSIVFFWKKKKIYFSWRYYIFLFLLIN